MKAKFVFIMIGVFCAVSTLLYSIVFTTSGSKFAVNKVVTEYVGHEGFSFENVAGNLGKGMTFQNLELKKIKDLPEGTVLKIQKLFFNLASLSPSGVTVEVENARLRLPGSEPVVMSGSFKQQQLDLNIYSKGFTVTEVLSYLPDFKKLVPIKGDVNDIDLLVTGHYLEPAVKGGFIIEKFVYQGFLLTKAPLSVDIQLKEVKGDIQLYGNVHLEEGEFKTKRVLVKLQRSHLNFSGPWDQPRLNLKGNAKVEKTKITIGLKGTIAKPELALSSEPSHSREKLMIMLATGKSWQSVDDAMDQGMNSAALTKDFIDYFFFAGKSNRFAERFGISDFSVQFDQNQKGIAAKKELSEKLEVGYGIKQTKTDQQAASVSQKLEGEYKVSDQISVGLEREVKTTQSGDLLNEQVNENNDKVLLKYKTTF